MPVISASVTFSPPLIWLPCVFSVNAFMLMLLMNFPLWFQDFMTLRISISAKRQYEERLKENLGRRVSSSDRLSQGKCGDFVLQRVFINDHNSLT